jgi:hypothetical protein
MFYSLHCFKKLTKKNIKKIGGKLSELYSLDVSIKTIILMGDLHTDKKFMSEYLNIIRKQKEIVNLVVDKFGQDKTYFYSEAPEEFREKALNTDNFSSSVITQYAKTNIPIKLSSITICDRKYSNCDDKYRDDILSIFDENSEINCIIVVIGLLHIPELKRLIIDKRPDIEIIIVNTVSNKQLRPLIPEITRIYPSVIDLLTIEPSYELQKETFIVEVLYDKDNEKIYKCPICKTQTGTAAPEDPTDTSLFVHNYNCPNKHKIPIEN